MITELLQQPGSFEFTLRPGTPLSVRLSVPYEVAGVPFGHVVVTRQRLPVETLTRASVLAQAIYTGRIGARSNQMHTYAGNGLAVWLGDADDRANLVGAYGGGAPATFTAAVTYVLTTIANGNGLTLGTTTGVTATTNTSAFVLVSPIDLFNQFAELTGNAWRVNPNGTVDIGAPSSLFVSDDVVIMREDGGNDFFHTGLEATSLELSEDFDDYQTAVIVNGNGASSSATFTGGKNFGGAADTFLLTSISSSNTTAPTCATAGTAFLNLHKTSRQELSISVVSNLIHDACRPGDTLNVYDPETDLVDLTHTVHYRGQVIYPVLVQLLGYTWPIREGMGVYTLQTQDGSSAVVDLTDWVAWETGDVKLEVGAPRRPAAKPTTNDWGHS